MHPCGIRMHECITNKLNKVNFVLKHLFKSVQYIIHHYKPVQYAGDICLKPKIKICLNPLYLLAPAGIESVGR
jgi:hypothetical protein